MLTPWIAVGAFITLGYFSIVPPAALSSHAVETEFSAARAAKHVEFIAREPHPMGSPAIAQVRDYLVSELEDLGLEPEFQTISAPDYFRPNNTVDVVNVMATIPGTATTGAVALMAHYDTVPTTPGANDNSAAVAALLESGRAILAGPSLRNDVILLFTDAEEPAPRPGSTTFVRESPVFDDISLVVNFEAIGGSGPSSLVETSGPEAWLVEQYAGAVADPNAFSFVSAVTALIGEVGTDFDPFRDAGTPGFHFAYVRGSPIYHSPADDLGSVGWDSLQHHGSNALGIAQHFGAIDIGAIPDSGSSVYFTLRPFFVQYSASWSKVGALLAAALLVFGLGRSMRRSRQTAGSLARESGITLLLTFLTTVIATLGWILIATLRSAPNVVEAYGSFIALFAMVGALAYWANGRVPKQWHVTEPGFFVVWVVLAVVTAFAAPGFSALFVIPALAAAIASTWRTRPRTWASIVRFALVAAPAMLLLVPAIDFFFQFGQPRSFNPDSSIPSVAAVAFLLAFLAAGLLIGVWSASGRGVGRLATGGSSTRPR